MVVVGGVAGELDDAAVNVKVDVEKVEAEGEVQAPARKRGPKARASQVRMPEEPSPDERAALRRASRRMFRLYCFACGRSGEASEKPTRPTRCPDCGGTMLLELSPE